MSKKGRDDSSNEEIPLLNKKKLNVMEYATITLAVGTIATFFLLYFLTNKQIGLSRNSARITLRAYIQVTDIIASQMEIGKKLELTIYYKNTGQTPAYNIRYKALVKAWGQGENKAVTNSDWEKLKNKPSEGNNVLGSNSTMNFIIPTELFIKDSTTIPDWKSTGKFLGVFGYIYYRDIFDSTTIHYSQFNLRFWRDKFIFDSLYNDADK